MLFTNFLGSLGSPRSFIWKVRFQVLTFWAVAIYGNYFYLYCLNHKFSPSWLYCCHGQLKLFDKRQCKAGRQHPRNGLSELNGFVLDSLTKASKDLIRIKSKIYSIWQPRLVRRFFPLGRGSQTHQNLETGHDPTRPDPSLLLTRSK